eukprot:CAMPEP_0194226480 /NCGR_PEP_ID=MMETSP0156-20130528/41943_1 /TAXON_ID=33649 /ORGANISM="Thalassionema nitzschioides, Strain L26-B" /LENGTH=105 /DNA_ID=CAMNT_0038958841 /DNA_START=174 /DNA_END=488 /DNA_ORIENTATION=-
MVLGKQGMRLEALKFSIYILIPVVASISFNNPNTQKYWADYYQYLKFPANPNTNLKEQYEKLAEQRTLQKEQRKEYLDQMKRLQESAQKSREQSAKADTEKKKWW